MRLLQHPVRRYASGIPHGGAGGGMIVDRKTVMSGLFAAALAVAGAASAQPTASAPAPRQIGVGETLRGELAAGDATMEDGSYFDLYTFQATAGQSYVVTLNSEEFDTYLHVSGPGGLVEDNDDAQDGVTNSKVEFTAPAAGEIQIKANSLVRREAGRYSISLQPGLASRHIVVDQQTQGELSAQSPKHTDGTPYQSFIFDGQAAQSITIDMKSKDFDTYLVLRKAGSSEDIVSDDDGGGGTDSQIFFTLPSAGAYEIRANAVSASARGRFTLKVSKGVAERKPAPTPIVYGRVVRGELKPGGGRDASGLFYEAFSFAGQKGDKVTISAVSSDFDPVLYLGAVDRPRPDQWLESNDDETGGGTDSLIRTILPADGTYEVHLVSYNAGEAGRYTMGLSVEH